MTFRDIDMGQAPPEFAAEMQAAMEADADAQGIDRSTVDEVIGEMFASAGVGDNEETAEAPEGESDAESGSGVPAPAEGEQPPGEPEVPPPPAPGGPLFADDTPEVPDHTAGDGAPSSPQEPPGPQLTPEQIAAFVELDRRVRTDPNLRQGLADLLVRPPAPQPQPAADVPPLPQLSEDDLESPAIRALIMVADRQRQELARLAEQVQATRQGVDQREAREHAEIANGAATAFQREHNLPDDLMNQVRAAASRTNAIQLYMGDGETGIDPRTGNQVTPDPYKAVEAALEIGYWNTPSARQFEFARQAQRQAGAHARKQKLAGIGGTSGSGPRQEPPIDTSTPEGRDKAAVALIAAGMYGENEGEA